MSKHSTRTEPSLPLTEEELVLALAAVSDPLLKRCLDSFTQNVRDGHIYPRGDALAVGILPPKHAGAVSKQFQSVLEARYPSVAFSVFSLSGTNGVTVLMRKKLHDDDRLL